MDASAQRELYLTGFAARARTPEPADQPTSPGIDEAGLLARAQARDAEAIREIVRRHNQRLFRIARSILRDDSEAEDVLQEAYFRAFSNLATFRGEARFGTWLARIVINEALGALRRRRAMVALDTVTEEQMPAAAVIPFPHAAGQIDPETLVAQRQFQMILERAIDTLPDAFRMVLVARVIEDMSIEETAELFDMPPETVKTRLHRARKLLKKEMEQRIGPMWREAFPFLGHRCNRLTEQVLRRLGLQ